MIGGGFEVAGYLAHVCILVGIYVLLASSLNLIAGYAGLVSVAHAAFYGLGAYSSALMAANASIPFALRFVLCILIGASAGAAVVAAVLRVQGDYFVIATFAFQVLAFSAYNNLASVTGGPMGIPGIPRPVILGWQLETRLDFLVLVSLSCALFLPLLAVIERSPFGRVLKAVREDELLAQALGKHVRAKKVVAFSISAGLAAAAGALYAHYVTFIDPTSFTVSESILIVSMVILGGAGRFSGPIVGAAGLVLLPEALRFVGIPGPIAGNFRQILYGAVLVAFMVWRPQGLAGAYSFGRREA